MAIQSDTGITPGPFGSGIAGVLAVVRTCRETLTRVRVEVGSATEADIGTLIEELGELALFTDAAELATVSEALIRGLPESHTAPLSAADWVSARSRRHTSRTAAGVVQLAQAMHPATVTRKAGPLAPGQDGEVLGQAILDATVPLPCARVALLEMRRLGPDLREDCLPVVWESYATVGAFGDPGFVRKLRPEMYAKFGRPDRLAEQEDKARSHTGLSFGRTDPIDGLTDYRLRLDAESAAILEAALDPLSKPQPEPDGSPDPRSPGRRRADALIDIIRRAVGVGAGPGTRPAAHVSVTVGLEDLKTQTQGCATVFGGVEAGRYLSLATACLLTCGNAALAPVITDDHGTPIVIGRTRRLFTTQQVRALHLRDGCCTFPGCTRPAGWADAHHLVHWIDGGETELDNAALLCSYHHHVVHSRRLAGWITTDPPSDSTRSAESACPPDGSEDPRPPPGAPRVHWNLTPGSYDTPLATRDGTTATEGWSAVVPAPATYRSDAAATNVVA